MVKMKKVFLLAFIVLVMCGNIYADNPKLTYSGGTVTDENIGIMVMSDEAKQNMAITSPYYHYAFIIPYSENWVFEKNEQYYLFGNNKNKNISINIYQADNKPDQEYLALMKQNLLENKDQTGTETADFSAVNGVTALITSVDAGKATKREEFKGIIQQNLFITKTNVNSRIVLHFSIINDTQSEIEQYINCLTRSFLANFMFK